MAGPDYAIRTFRDILQFSGVQSVDEFLESPVGSDYQRLGKLVIAQELVQYEKLERLFQIGKPNWYKSLWKVIRNSYDDCVSGRLSIITFNYDRSLEYFLATSMENYYGAPEHSGKRASALRIVHVNGLLGYCDWQDSSGRNSVRTYRDDLNTIGIAAQAISLIHENSTVAHEVDTIPVLLAACSRVMFLGFSFHETNIKKLGGYASFRDKNCSGTCLGLSMTDRYRVMEKIPRIQLHPITVEAFMTDHANLS
jgi:hypothetical protein